MLCSPFQLFAEPFVTTDVRLSESEFLTRKAVFSQSKTVVSVSESGSKNVHQVSHQVAHAVKQVAGQPTEEVIFKTKLSSFKSYVFFVHGRMSTDQIRSNWFFKMKLK